MAEKKIKLEIDYDLNDDWIKKVAGGYFQRRELRIHDELARKHAQRMREQQQHKSEQQQESNE